MVSILPLYDKEPMLTERFPYKTLFLPSCRLLYKNVLFSFIPPFFSRFNKIALDLVGPASALLIMNAVLNIAYLYKPNKSLKKESMSPTLYMISYALLIPSMSYFVCKLVGKSRLLLYEILSLLGYYLYSHILTLIFALVLIKDDARDFFYIMIVCTSTSTFRVVMILSRSMRNPALRFIVTTFVVTVLLLDLIYQYFVYVHP